jgi:MFS family permease
MLLLAGGMAALYGMLQLAAGTATLTFEEVGGSEALAGFAPAIFLVTAALAALPAGGLMDRHGRAPVLAAGFAAGIAGCLVEALGVSSDSMVLALLGFALVGVSVGTVQLSRTAAADMYPPERRARGISLVLFGAVFGALLGPLLFVPLLEGHEGHGSALSSAWIGAGGFVLVGLLLMFCLRPDPQRIANALGHDQPTGGGPAGPAAPLRDILKRPGVLPPLLASAASFSAMVPMMTLVGSALVDHGHSESAVIPVVAVHFVGMFGLFAIVGRVIERVGTAPCLSGGLLLLAACSAALLGTVESVPLTAVALMGVGLGWNFAFVAATAELSDRVSPAERGTMLGFADQVSALSCAALVVLGGLGLAAIGLATVALGAAAVAALPALWILRSAAQPAPA